MGIFVFAFICRVVDFIFITGLLVRDKYIIYNIIWEKLLFLPSVSQGKEKPFRFLFVFT